MVASLVEIAPTETEICFLIKQSSENCFMSCLLIDNRHATSLVGIFVSEVTRNTVTFVYPSFSHINT